MGQGGDTVYYEECPSCKGPTSCGVMHPKVSVVCTRPAGHEGKHVACTSRHAAHTWDADVRQAQGRQKKEGRAAESQARRDALLESLRRAAVPLGEWARAHGYQERDVRGDIGTLRRLGHSIKAIGSGRFALEEK